MTANTGRTIDESPRDQLESNRGIQVPEEALINVLRLYGRVEDFSETHSFGGWEWWRLCDMIDEPDKKARKPTIACPEAIARLFIELPGIRQRLAELREASLSGLQATIHERLAALSQLVASAQAETYNGTNYRLLGSEEDVLALSRLGQILGSDQPADRTYELGFYICDIPSRDASTLRNFVINEIRSEGNPDLTQEWITEPCVVKSGAGTNYYPNGAGNPSTSFCVPSKR